MYDEEPKVMDWNRLFLFTDGDPDDTQELLDLFTENAEESIRDMQALCTEIPDENWKSAVHKLKGSAANLGADLLAQHCKIAEKSWQEPCIVRKNLVAEIIVQYDILKEILSKPVLEYREM